jgi:hypothetical protein
MKGLYPHLHEVFLALLIDTLQHIRENQILFRVQFKTTTDILIKAIMMIISAHMIVLSSLMKYFIHFRGWRLLWRLFIESVYIIINKHDIQLLFFYDHL